MNRVSVCPGEDTLAAFAGGELSSAALPRVARHAADCTACGVQLMAANTSATEPDLLGERYRLLRKLGEGGMGVVYEAQDVVLGEHVALKLLRDELARDERALEYLKSEAKLSRQIGHEHVCRVFDLGQQTASGRTLHYLSMELLRGPSLRNLLAQGPLRPALALRLADQVLSGLQAAHAAGVLHRDLKPDNMLLRYASSHEPHAVITDFGLARAFRAGQRHVTASRSLVGSAAYLAPEQVEEAPLTEATDLYSFGVVLFELLTGQQPFRAETALGVALKRLSIAPPRPSDICPGLGTRYDAFILRCLARDPRARFDSAALARAELRKLIDAPQTVRRARPRLRITALLGALSLASSAGLLVAATDSGTTSSMEAASPPKTVAPSMTSPSAAAALQQPRANIVPLAVSHVLSDGSETISAQTAGSSRKRAAQRAARTALPNPAAQRVTGAVQQPPAAAPEPAQPADLLTPDGFLDPFAE